MKKQIMTPKELKKSSLVLFTLGLFIFITIVKHSTVQEVSILAFIGVIGPICGGIYLRILAWKIDMNEDKKLTSQK
ncbi:hypothetical protein ACSVDA_24040 [Cytobacillus sp. Hm23]